MADSVAERPGVYCSTSGTFFTDKEELTEHYKSDYHRYNLKRKVAGLPPVTREWFDSRKEQLSSSAAALSAAKVWTDPLTRKRFGSENTYTAFVRSKKYQELVRKSGRPAPAPLVSIRKAPEPGAEVRPDASGAQPRSFTVKAPNRGPTDLADEEMEGGEGSDWETASEDEESGGEGQEEPQPGPEWDVRRSLFDNHCSDSLEANLEYMYRRFGFYLPDAEFLADPEGLLRYLGAKLQDGHVPLYASGLDPEAKRLGSLHAVQRHMVDTNQCKLAWEAGADEEYEDFYDYSPALPAEGEGGELAVADAAVSLAPGGYELVVGEGRSAKVIGSREFLRYYRQNHRQADGRAGARVSALQQRYRNLGVALIESPGAAQAARAVKQAQKAQKKGDRIRLRTDLQGNTNRNLPRNVPY